MLITSKSLYRDVLVNLISDELYTLRFGTNMAQSSLFDVAGAEKISVSNIKQINSHLNPGRYRTNVVYSPLTRWTGSLQSNSSNDGMWILETSIERPHVAMNWSLPVKLGLFLSIFGLLLVLVLLLYGVYRPA